MPFDTPGPRRSASSGPSAPLPATPPALRILGIDVGLSGAIAALDFPPNRGTVPSRVEVYDLPTLATKGKTAKGSRTLDVVALLRLLDRLHAPSLIDGTEVRAVLEDVHSMPGQGVASMFSFGRSLGVIETALAASRIPFDPVRPNVWKKALRVPVAEDGIVLRVDQLLPGYSHLWRGPRGGILDGRAEAALLALYGASPAST